MFRTILFLWLVSLAVCGALPVAADCGEGRIDCDAEGPSPPSLQVVLHKPVIQARSSEFLNPLPVGATFLIYPAPASGPNWPGHENEWAIWNGSGWDFEFPIDGSLTYVQGNDAISGTRAGEWYRWSDQRGWDLIAEQAMGRMPVGRISSSSMLSEYPHWKHHLITCTTACTVNLEVPAALEFGTVVILTSKATVLVTVTASGDTISSEPFKTMGQWQTLRLQVMVNEHGLAEWVQW
jgi:Na+-transporting NADH:ubiquinone oxidoreductase subunit NqrB